MTNASNPENSPRELWNRGKYETAVTRLAESSNQDDQFLAEHLLKLLQIVQDGLATSNPEQKSSLQQEAETQIVMWLPTEWDEPQGYIKLANQSADIESEVDEQREQKTGEGEDNRVTQTDVPPDQQRAYRVETETGELDIPLEDGEKLPVSSVEDDVPSGERANRHFEKGQEAFHQKEYQRALDAYQRAKSLLEDAGQKREEVEPAFYQEVRTQLARVEKAISLQSNLTRKLQEIEKQIAAEQYADAMAICQELIVLDDERVSKLEQEAKKGLQKTQQTRQAIERAEELEQEEKYEEALTFLSAWREQPEVNHLIQRIEHKQAEHLAQIEDYVRQADEAAERQDFAGAIALYDAALALEPNNTRIQAEQQQTQEALQLWQTIDSLIKEADEDLEKGRWELCLPKYEEARDKDHEGWFQADLEQRLQNVKKAIRDAKEHSRNTIETVIPDEKWPDILTEQIRKFYQFPGHLFSDDEIQKDQEQLQTAASKYQDGHFEYHLSPLLSTVGAPGLETNWSELADQLVETNERWKEAREDDLVRDFFEIANERKYQEIISVLDEIARLLPDVQEAAQTAPQIDDAIELCLQARKDTRHGPSAISQALQLLQKREPDTPLDSLLQPRYERLETLQNQLEELQLSRLEKEVGEDLILIEQNLYQDQAQEARERLNAVATKELPPGSQEHSKYYHLDRWCQRLETVAAQFKRANKAYHRGQWQKFRRAGKNLSNVYQQIDDQSKEQSLHQYISPIYKDEVEILEKKAIKLDELGKTLQKLDRYDKERLIQPQYTKQVLNKISEAVTEAIRIDAKSEYVTRYQSIWDDMVRAADKEITQAEELEQQAMELKTTRDIKRKLDRALEHVLVAATLRPTDHLKSMVKEFRTYQKNLDESKKLEQEARSLAKVDRAYREASLKLRGAAALVLDFAPALSANFTKEAKEYEEKEAYQQPFLEQITEAEQLVRANQLLEALLKWKAANRLFNQLPPDVRNHEALESVRRDLEDALLNQLRKALTRKDYENETVTKLLQKAKEAKFSFGEKQQETIQIFKRYKEREQVRKDFLDALSKDDLTVAKHKLNELEKYTDPNDQKEVQELVRWQQQYEAGEAVARAYDYWNTTQKDTSVKDSVERLRTDIEKLKETEKTLLTVQDFYVADPQRLILILETHQQRAAVMQAKLYELEEDFEAAIGAYETLANMNKDNSDWTQAANRIKETLNHYQAAKEATSDQLKEAVSHLAQIDLEGRSWTQVQALYQVYLQHLRERGQLAEDVHNFQEALVHYELIQKLEPTDEAYPRLAQRLKDELEKRRRLAGLALSNYNISAEELINLTENIQEAAKWPVGKPEDREQWAPFLVRELTKHKENIEQADASVQEAKIALEQAREDGNFQRVFDAFENVSLRLKRQRNRVREVYETTINDRNRYERILSAVNELKNEINNASKLDQMDRLQKLLSELDSEKQLRTTREAWDMLEQYLNEV